MSIDSGRPAEEEGWLPPAPETDPAPTVKTTYLSGPPAPGSAWVAAIGVALLAAPSAARWLDLWGAGGGALVATGELVLQDHQYWRLLTTLLVHGDVLHLLGNSLPFALLGYLLFGYFGPWVHPVSTLTLGGLVTALSLATSPPGLGLVGASGVVYLMAGFWLTLYVLLERRLSLARRLMRALGFALVVLVPTTIDPGVSHRTHAFGLAAGLVWAAGYFGFHRARFRRAEGIEWE